MADSRTIMRQLRAKLDRVVQRSAADALGQVMQRTPVRTGEARGNWHVTKGGRIPDHDRKRRPAAALSEGRAAIAQVGVGDRVTISNPAPHAPALEVGLDPHKAHAMVRKTAAALPGIIRKNVAAERGRP